MYGKIIARGSRKFFYDDDDHGNKLNDGSS